MNDDRNLSHICPTLKPRPCHLITGPHLKKAFGRVQPGHWGFRRGIRGVARWWLNPQSSEGCPLHPGDQGALQEGATADGGHGVGGGPPPRGPRGPPRGGAPGGGSRGGGPRGKGVHRSPRESRVPGGAVWETSTSQRSGSEFFLLGDESVFTSPWQRSMLTVVPTCN